MRKHSKKFQRLLWVVVLSVIYCMLPSRVNQSVIHAATSVSTIQKNEFEMKYKVYLDGATNGQRTMGVEFEIKNNGPDYEGELQLTVPEDMDEVNISNEEKARLMYAKEVNLAAGETKKVVICLPSSTSNSSYCLSMEGKENKQRNFSQDIKLVTKNNTKVTIGVLTDEKNGLDYFENNIRVVELTEENMPNIAQGYDVLDLIVVNDYDTSKLPEQQYAAIKEWVGNGGTLVVGTGENYNKTLGAFRDDFIAGTIGKTKKISTSFSLKKQDISAILQYSGGNAVKGAEESIEETEENKGKTTVPKIEKQWLDISVKDAEVVLKDEKTPLLQKITYKSGNIIVANIDLSLENSIWNTMGNKILQTVLSNLSETKLSQLSCEAVGEAYYDSCGFNGNLWSMPKIGVFAIIFVVYILIIGPIVYIILRKLNKRNWIWGVVSSISILVSIFIYIIMSGYRLSNLRGSYINYVTYLDGDCFKEEVEMQVLVPYNQKYHFATDNTYKLQCNYTNNDMFIYSTTSATQIQEVGNDYNIKIIDGAESNQITVRNLPSFKTIGLRATKNVESTNGINVQLSYKDWKMNGNIVNNSGYDLKNVFIISNSMFYGIDGIKNGKSADIGKFSVDSNNGYFDLSGSELFTSMLGYETYSTELMQDQYYQAVEEMSNRFYYGNTNYDGVMIGLIDENYSSEFIKNIDMDTKGVNVAIIPFKYASEDGEDEYESSISEYGEEKEYYCIDSGGYDTIGKNNYTIKYQFNRNDVIKKFVVFNWNEEQEILGYEADKVYALNQKTNKYDLICDMNSLSKGENISVEANSYLSEDNIVSFKYECTDEDYEEEYMEIYIPKIGLQKEGK